MPHDHASQCVRFVELAPKTGSTTETPGENETPRWTAHQRCKARSKRCLRHLLQHIVAGGEVTWKARQKPSAVTASGAPLGDYADLYLRVAYDCLHMFRVRELDAVGEAAAEAAARVQNGGKIVSAIGTPHIMYAGACGVDVPGQPGLASEPNKGYNDGWQGDDLGAGDVLLTANSSNDIAAAHGKGCYVIGVGFPMTTNRYSPPNYNDHPEHGEHGFEDMCSIFLYDWAPKEDGAVTPRLRAPHA
eukprot:SAG31_NODE_13562_length_861_cov_1.077428_1_plen_245_part_01